MIKLDWPDIVPLGLYLLLLAWLGLRAYRRNAGQEEYLLSSRSLSIPAFVATLVSTWYGGILGVGEFTFRYGISSWVIFGLPYYFFALIFALFIAPKVRRAHNYSIPDMLYRTYGKPSGFLGSIFLVFMTSPAPYILMLTVLIRHWLGIGFIGSLLLGTLFSIFYVYRGGFRSVVQTDKLQFFLMFGGFILLIFYLINSSIPLGSLPAHLDALHKNPAGTMHWQKIAVWFLIASWTFIDPGFHQRSAAARTPAVARKGILISIGFWFLFDMLTLISGLYAFVLLPGSDPLMAYPNLARLLLPPFVKGLFFTGLLATIMSTIDSYTFLSALSFGRDLLWPFRKKTPVNQLVKWGLIISALVSVVLIVLVPSVIRLWYNLGSLFIPPLLLPLLATYFPKIKLQASITFFIMLGSFLLTAVFFLGGLFLGKYPLGMEPFFAGFVLSFTAYAAAGIWNKFFLT